MAAWPGRGGETTARAAAEAAYATLYEATAESDRKIVEAVGKVAAARGVSRAQIAYAWLCRHPVVAASLVGALKTRHIDDAVAALTITLTDDEVGEPEAAYTPRADTQGVSDPAMLACATEAATGFSMVAA